MAWRSSMSIVIGPGATQRWTFSWGGADRGVQYFMAHPVFVGETLVLSNQTKASVAGSRWRNFLRRDCEQPRVSARDFRLGGRRGHLAMGENKS